MTKQARIIKTGKGLAMGFSVRFCHLFGIRILLLASNSGKSSAGFGFCRQRCIDRSADARRVFILWVHRLVINVYRRSKLYSEGIAERMVGVDSFPDFFAVDVP